jgi:hypothetical protein
VRRKERRRVLEFRIYENAPHRRARRLEKHRRGGGLVKRFRPWPGAWRSKAATGRGPDVTLSRRKRAARVAPSRAESANDLLLTLKRDGVRVRGSGALKTSEFTKWAPPSGGRDGGARSWRSSCRMPLGELSRLGATDETTPARTAGSALSITLARENRMCSIPMGANRRHRGVRRQRPVRIRRTQSGKPYVLGFSWWDANGDHRRGRVTATGKNGETAVLADSLALPSQEGRASTRFSCRLMFARTAVSN